jgi:hypothetical protein
MADKTDRWMMDGLFGGDAAYRESMLTEFLYPVRDLILDRAGLFPGQTLLDVGSSDGLIGFAGLERVEATGLPVASFRAAGRAGEAPRMASFISCPGRPPGH